MKNFQKSSFVFVAFAIIILSLNSVSAITGSIGNARMVLYPEVNGWFSTTIEKSILVKNVNDEEIKITLEADEEGKEFLEVIDTEFILQPGDEKKAQFIVKVKKEGTYEGRINVFFSPIDGKGAGVALSSTITVIAKKDQGYEESEEDEENLEEEDEELIDSITGEVIEDNKNSFSKGQLFLALSTTLLLIILIVLMAIMKNKKRDSKKGGKLNGKKKS
ncbi:hypothetical protein J4474_02275 [Candidatus Pacearchaeota archaeon]|nr:hypothetical protein [Candidatus Pacearchaeota archaeon]